MAIGTSNIRCTIPLYLPNGTETAPSLTYTSDTSSGVFLASGGSNLGIVTGGTSRLWISNTAITPTVPITGLTASNVTLQSVRYGVTTLSTSTSLLGNGNVLQVCDSASNITVTLPDITTLDGRVFHILNVNATGNVILNTFTGTQFVDTTLVSLVLFPLDRIRLIAYGTSWYTY